MIPRLKPYLDREEFYALFQKVEEAVSCFEAEYARLLGVRHAISFPYGRSAQWAFFKALGIDQSEVILPAYTCSVVAHAIVLGGNIPRFVDISLCDYNMSLDLVSDAINERTRGIIATHLFGYPLDVEALAQLVEKAQAKYGHKIWIVQDCAHSFGAQWQDRPVYQAGDAALFGLNISKMITSIFGGMLTTDNDEIATKLRSWRDRHFTNPGKLKTIRRILYLMAVYCAFNDNIYGMVNWLEDNTRFLNHLTKAYHLDDVIHFPPDYLDYMLPVEARVGLVQLRKYQAIIHGRQANARYYAENLVQKPGWDIPPLIEGATYSHYVLRVADRSKMLNYMAKRGIQLGQLIEYCIPYSPGYEIYRGGVDFPNALLCSQRTINLPVYPSLSLIKREEIVKALNRFNV